MRASSFPVALCFLLSLREALGACGEPLLQPSSCCVDPAPPQFDAVFTTTAGSFTLHIERRWAPLGVDRFYNMIQYGYLTNRRILTK